MPACQWQSRQIQLIVKSIIVIILSGLGAILLPFHAPHAHTHTRAHNNKLHCHSQSVTRARFPPPSPHYTHTQTQHTLYCHTTSTWHPCTRTTHNVIHTHCHTHTHTLSLSLSVRSPPPPRRAAHRLRRRGRVTPPDSTGPALLLLSEPSRFPLDSSGSSSQGR